MTTEQIQDILARKAFPGASAGASLVETHISWVILTPDYAFKIKKPVRLHFLDFSTPDLRNFYCSEEIRLNRRLAPDLYLAVLPIGTNEGLPAIGSGGEPVVDYAVQMRRMDSQRQMDRLLDRGLVRKADVQQLALLLAPFHLKHRLYEPGQFHLEQETADFCDLFTLRDTLCNMLGASIKPLLKKLEMQIPAFLQQHAGRLRRRAETGFWVEGHGDLHSRNIFLAGKPVVFDCIEFNRHFRRLDVLSELAFLCMDLAFHGKPGLSKAFLQAYLQQWNIMPLPEDRRLFGYFILYRANVRLKVAALEWTQHPSREVQQTASKYWKILSNRSPIHHSSFIIHH